MTLSLLALLVPLLLSPSHAADAGWPPIDKRLLPPDLLLRARRDICVMRNYAEVLRDIIQTPKNIDGVREKARTFITTYVQSEYPFVANSQQNSIFSTHIRDILRAVKADCFVGELDNKVSTGQINTLYLITLPLRYLASQQKPLSSDEEFHFEGTPFPSILKFFHSRWAQDMSDALFAPQG